MLHDRLPDGRVRTGADWAVIEELIEQGELTETGYEGHTYYMKRTSAQRRQ